MFYLIISLSLVLIPLLIDLVSKIYVELVERKQDKRWEEIKKNRNK